MRRVYIDSYVEVCTRELLEKAYKLGYQSIVCINLQQNMESHKLLTYRKVLIEAGDVSELKSTLRQLNYAEYYVTVIPRSVEVARWASHDTRIDSIMLTRENISVFDKKQFSTMKYYGKPLEVSLKDVFECKNTACSSILKRVVFSSRSGVPLIVGSGARDWYELIPPYSLVKLLVLYFDLEPQLALLSITDIPRQVLLRKKAYSY